MQFLHSTLIVVFAACSVSLAQDTLRSQSEVEVEGKAVFTMHTVVITNGNDVTRTSEYIDTDNARVLTASTHYSLNPLKIRTMELEDVRTGRRETVEHIDKRMYKLSSRATSKEQLESETIEEDDEERLLSSHLIIPFIQQNLPRLTQGEEIEFELAVPSRLEQIGFDLSYEGTAKVLDQECYTIKMSASSWIIRQLVDPLTFYVRKSPPHALLRYVGRLAPTDKNGDKLDGVVTYTYE